VLTHNRKLFMSFLNENAANELYRLEQGLESVYADMQKAFELTDIVKGMEAYRLSTGIESDDLLLQVADYAVRNTNLKGEDLLEISSESGVSDFIGTVVNSVTGKLMELIKAFIEWLIRMSSEQRKLLDTCDTLDKKLAELDKEKTNRRIKMSLSVVNMVQINYKVITDPEDIVKALGDLGKTIEGLVYNYSNSLIDLSSALNKLVEEQTGNTSAGESLGKANEVVGTFFKSVETMFESTDSDGKKKGKLLLGNRYFAAYGYTDDLTERLKGTGENAVSANRMLSRVSYRFEDGSNESIEIGTKYSIPNLSKSQVKEIINTSRSILKNIIKYSDEMEKNLDVQMRLVKDGKTKLEELEAARAKKVYKVDGRNDLTDLEKIRSVYSYQSIAWRWGTTPVTPAITHVSKMVALYQRLCDLSIANLEKDLLTAEEVAAGGK